ncbi:MAG: amino acid permease [Planctomycetes bacterium]|nr:amino acid permease [Planctomycetota bacterium]
MTTSQNSPPSGSGPELPRVLGPWSAASILIGSIIGSGIFVKPAKIAASLPSPGWILVCWAFAGLLALIGSLVFAELGSLYPSAGGQYTYLKEAFGKLTAFLFGWTTLMIVNSASIAALAVISAGFFFNLLPEKLAPAAESHWFQTVPVLMIAILTGTNILGVRWGALIQNLLTLLKLAVLAGLILGLFLPGQAHSAHLQPFWEIRGSPGAEAIWSGFTGAFLAIFWAYDGWYLLSFSGGEIRNPRRNIPVGFILGILIVIAVYIAANLAYMGIMELDPMARVTGERGGVAAEVASTLYGKFGLMMVSIGILGSTFGAVNGNVLTGPRLAYAMARDGLFVRRVAEVHPRFRTPAAAIFLQSLIAAVYVYAGTFDQLTDSVVFAAWIFYLLTVLAYFVLRRRREGPPGAFRSPGHPFLPLIFIAFAAVFLVYNFWMSASSVGKFLANPGDEKARDGIYPMITTLIILAGLPVYWIFQRGQPKEPAA